MRKTLAAFVILIAPGPALAQDAIQACLCSTQRLDVAKGRWEAAKRTYDVADARLNEVKRDIENARAAAEADPEDQGAIDRLKLLLARQDELTVEMFSVELPHYRAVVDRYDRSIADYKARCEGRAFYPDDLARAKRDLVCESQP